MAWTTTNTVVEALALPEGEHFTPMGFKCVNIPDMTEEAAEHLISISWQGEVRTQSELVVIARSLGAFEGYANFVLVPDPVNIRPQPKGSKDPLGSVTGEKRQLLARQIIHKWGNLFGARYTPNATIISDLIDRYTWVNEHGSLGEVLTGATFEEFPDWLILYHIQGIVEFYYSKHEG